jgi:predicted phage tail protein
MTDPMIRGAGAKTPTEAKDTLDSQGYLRLVDVLCEGEIQGPATPEKNGISKSSPAYAVEGYKDIFVENTPVLRSAAVVKTGTYTQTSTVITVSCTGHGYVSGAEVRLFPSTGLAATDNYKITSTTSNSFTCASKNTNVTSGSLALASPGDFNFTKFEITSLYGTPTQTLPASFNAVESEISVGTKVEFSVPLVRTITNTEINAARITINIPALQKTTDKGDIVGTTLELAIDISENGGGFYTVLQDKIVGRSGDLYQKDYEVQLIGKTFPIDIRVRRITPDSTSSKLTDEFTWFSYVEINYVRLSYPNTALVAGRIAAEQFSNIPSRSYRIRGRKVAIPSNATVELATGRLIYSGAWDGTFGAAQWTTDPAWCMWNLLTDYRAGFGDHLTASVLDKWAFYSASQYASGLVKTGLKDSGNNDIYEPRFSCNVSIQTREEAFKLISDLSSVFRVMPYWSAGALTISADQPKDPSFLFNRSNVAESGFTYQSSSQKVRPTVAIVSYLDLDTRELGYEQVEDADGIVKYGMVTTEVAAFACTSRSQANRIGRWILYSEKYEAETVNFTTSIDAGVIVRPGQVIAISDPVRAGARRGGRISSATTTAITVDNATGLNVTNTPTLSVILSDGSTQTRNISSISGSTITVSAAFTTAPNPNSIWIYESSDLKTSLWRVISVEEKDGTSYIVNALKYDPSKFAYIEAGEALEPRDVTNLTLIVDPPTSVAYTEALYLYQSQVRSKIILSWPAVSNVAEYQVKWRKDSGNWQSAISGSADYEILDITPGAFNIEIYSLNAAAKPSTTAAKISFAALGKTAPPSNVVTFTAALDPVVGVTLNWDPITDLDVQGYEIWQGSAFGSGTKIGVFAATSKKLGLIAAGTTQWWIKALDTSGSYSTTAISASLTITAATAPTISGAFSNDSLVLNWTAVTGSLSTAAYEVRYGTVASTWASATPIGTVQGTTMTIKGAWVGTRRFFIAAIDLNGNYGTAATYDAVITAPSQPTITQQVVDNNVLLQWTDSTQTLPILYYELRRGTTFAGATVIGTKQGKFTTVFETVAGNFTYWLVGIDSAGNVGTPGSISAQVNQPPDYVLKLNQNSTFTGTKTNLAAIDVGLLASVDTTETWQSHFTSRSWTTPQDQINAGYSIYALPSQTSGQYFEDIDYGAIVAGSKVSTTLTANLITGSKTITPSISVRGTTSTAGTYSQTTTTITVTSTAHGLSAGALVYLDFTTGTATDGSYVVATAATNTFTVTSTTSTTTSGNVSWIKWTVYPGVDSVFATNFQFIRAQYDFASAGGDDLLQITGLNIRLDSKLKNDSGAGTANSADSGGTTVTFTTTFIDVDSISVTPSGTTPVIAIYDFVDVPNPTSFKVLLYNTSGVRVSGAFSWSARGF